MPARTLDRIEKGLEIPPSYVMRSIYVRLVDEVEYNRFKDRIEKLEEENPNDNFMDLLYKDLFGNQNNEDLEAVNAEIDDSIDNLDKNKKKNFAEEEIYVTPRVGHSYEEAKESAKRIEEMIQKQQLEDNN